MTATVPEGPLPPPILFQARFTVHGQDALTLGRKAVAYAKALGGRHYAVISYTPGVVDLVRVDDPDRAEQGVGLMWGCTIDVTLSLLDPATGRPLVGLDEAPA